MDQALKGILAVAKMELSYITLLLKLGARAPVPRSPILRSIIGLKGKPKKAEEHMRTVLATDAE